MRSYSDELEFVVPVQVDGPAALQVVGVWAMNHRAKRTPPGTRAGRQVQLALERLKGLGTADGRVIVAGDFNDNVIWTKRAREFTMADCADACEGYGLRSVYHATRSAPQGREPDPTHFWEAHGGQVNTYHIDYIWAPCASGRRRSRCRHREAWYDTGLSDHVPLSATLAVPVTS